MRPEHWLFTIPLRLRSLFCRAQVDQEVGRRVARSPRPGNRGIRRRRDGTRGSAAAGGQSQPYSPGIVTRLPGNASPIVSADLQGRFGGTLSRAVYLRLRNSPE